MAEAFQKKPRFSHAVLKRSCLNILYKERSVAFGDQLVNIGRNRYGVTTVLVCGEKHFITVWSELADIIQSKGINPILRFCRGYCNHVEHSLMFCVFDLIKAFDVEGFKSHICCMLKTKENMYQLILRIHVLGEILSWPSGCNPYKVTSTIKEAIELDEADSKETERLQAELEFLQNFLNGIIPNFPWKSAVSVERLEAIIAPKLHGQIEYDPMSFT